MCKHEHQIIVYLLESSLESKDQKNNFQNWQQNNYHLNHE